VRIDLKMTIYCNKCDIIPLTYLAIRGRYLCIKCASKEYHIKLRNLNDEYVGVIK